MKKRMNGRNWWMCQNVSKFTQLGIGEVGLEFRDPEGFGGKYQAIVFHAIQRLPVLCLS